MMLHFKQVLIFYLLRLVRTIPMVVAQYGLIAYLGSCVCLQMASQFFQVVVLFSVPMLLFVLIVSFKSYFVLLVRYKHRNTYPLFPRLEALQGLETMISKNKEGGILRSQYDKDENWGKRNWETGKIHTDIETKNLHLRRLTDTDIRYLFYIFPMFISLKKTVLLSMERNFQVHIREQGWVRVFKPKVTRHQFVFR